jgi:hypothetical protein
VVEWKELPLASALGPVNETKEVDYGGEICIAKNDIF